MSPAGEIQKKRDVGGAVVHLSHVGKRFGGNHVLEDVSLSVEAGTVMGLIGANGAGKTTLFSLISGYISQSYGTIEIFGWSPKDVAKLRSKIGVLPQDAKLPPDDTVEEFLYDLAVLQNIAVEDRKKEITRVLAEVKGDGWEGKRCKKLSHGMAKRVAIAQALLGEPKLLLLDEPTAGLDPKVAYDIRQLIKKQKAKRTVIVSSHNLFELEEICDAAVILEGGKLSAFASMEDLTSAVGEIRVKLASPFEFFDEVKKLPYVTRVDYMKRTQELVVYYVKKVEGQKSDISAPDAEAVIELVLTFLLQKRIKISGVSKGHGLEQRVLQIVEPRLGSSSGS